MSCGTVSQSFVSAIGDPEFKARPFNISPSILLNSKDQKEKAKCREWLTKTKRKLSLRTLTNTYLPTYLPTLRKNTFKMRWR